MRFLLLLLIMISLVGCFTPRLSFKSGIASKESGDEFYQSIMPESRQNREDSALHEILGGNMPSFLKKFTVIKFDTSINGKKYRTKIFVLPDYLSIGSAKNFARIPLTPTTAQSMADSLHCFLPTRTIVDLIYKNAKVKLEPIPMYALRDSAVTMYQHHLIIEGQRKLRKGLIAGIKKDVIITGQLKDKPGKVAIYGWHRLTGIPIQPVYTGHVDWYVDYSHGIRLIYDIIIVNGKKYHYTEILRDATMQKLIADEDMHGFYKYP